MSPGLARPEPPDAEVLCLSSECSPGYRQHHLHWFVRDPEKGLLRLLAFLLEFIFLRSEISLKHFYFLVTMSLIARAFQILQKPN